jgi:hypothetical protein
MKKAILALMTVAGLALFFAPRREVRVQQPNADLIDTNVNLLMKSNTFVFPFVSEMVH